MNDREAPGGDSSRDGESADGEGDDGSVDDEEWQFTLEDIERRETEAAEQEAVEERSREPLEAGTPSLENVLFVVLGALLALFVISRLLVG